MRVAIVSSPRSGNTWVRSVLATTLSLDQIGVHNYVDLPAELPQSCILQLHWYREPNFQQFLVENGFRVVVIARHPLDLLISVLHFIQHEPLTSQWLAGNAEIPNELVGQSPVSETFLDYALSWGAENLLAISYQWWHDKSVIKTKYEDFVRSPHYAFSTVLNQLCGESMDLNEAIAQFDLKHFQAKVNHHGWQGRPGLWRQLIPFGRANAIYSRHKRIFDDLGYGISFNWLSASRAESNWRSLSA
ncbi:hypothetical protein [Caballeronia sp. M23-90]